MKNPSIILLALALPFTVSAQSDTPDAKRARAAVATLERHIESREHRAAELTEDIITKDKRIESRIDRIIETLEGVTDSTESQVRVTQMKEKAIGGLKRTIEYYDQKRRGLKTETMERDPKITRDTLFSDIGKFDGRIEKRVEQILELSKSMQTHKDYEKWRTVQDDSYWGWGGYRERNPKYYQNRKEVRHTDQSRKELTGELDASIDRLDRRNRDINEKLKKDISDQYREMLTAELEKNTNLIEMREVQKNELAVNKDPQTDAIGRGQALNIESMIEDMGEDLERDFYAMFAIYAELNQERTALKSLRAQLEEYKAMAK